MYQHNSLFDIKIQMDVFWGKYSSDIIYFYVTVF